MVYYYLVNACKNSMYFVLQIYIRIQKTEILTLDLQETGATDISSF